MYVNIFTKPSQYSLYYHRVNNSTDNQPVIHTLGNRDHSMDNLYISQHSTLNTQHSAIVIQSQLSQQHTLHTQRKFKNDTQQTHTHTRQDKTITHRETLTVQHTTIRYTLYRHSTSTVQVCHTHTGYHGQTHTLHTDANHTPSTHTISSQYHTLIHSLHPRKFHTHSLPEYLIILKYPHILPYPPY